MSVVLSDHRIALGGGLPHRPLSRYQEGEEVVKRYYYVNCWMQDAFTRDYIHILLCTVLYSADSPT